MGYGTCACVHGHSTDILVTVPSTDTRTWGMVHVCVHGCSTNILVTVPSMDTRTWNMVHVCVSTDVPRTS